MPALEQATHPDTCYSQLCTATQGVAQLHHKVGQASFYLKWNKTSYNSVSTREALYFCFPQVLLAKNSCKTKPQLIW